jgi:hypothetical protein
MLGRKKRPHYKYSKLPHQERNLHGQSAIYLPIYASEESLLHAVGMAGLDAKVASIIDRAGPESDEDEDALIAALEDDDDVSLAALREQRLQQLHAEVARANLMRSSDYGTFTEIKDEKTLMDITTQAKLCVVHFFKPDFGRCGVMDGHLEVRSNFCQHEIPF